MSRWRSLEQMEAEAANLAVTGLGLEVRASPAHPGGVCRTATVPCPLCLRPGAVQRRFGSTLVHCTPCSGGFGIVHDPVRCWELLR
ncbi:hypothetical protein [Streptomyces bambusae]|uniref:Transcription factor zinc-finger domain-containing protein n=1 Tax=Streptomyces bambusae TaxID=1550616 RepID=A0ABS6ZCQ4_9ACTN|nr:hypothetical protein [Streptomyces bambusae]MBW5485513.1 hypothetical protein [Streptomyces bambusae]